MFKQIIFQVKDLWILKQKSSSIKMHTFALLCKYILYFKYFYKSVTSKISSNYIIIHNGIFRFGIIKNECAITLFLFICSDVCYLIFFIFLFKIFKGGNYWWFEIVWGTYFFTCCWNKKFNTKRMWWAIIIIIN